MPTRIRRLFAGTGGERALVDGARALGRLATWWLRSDAVERIRAYPGQESLLQPPLLQKGEFLALFETRENEGWVDVAFGIPLEWRRDCTPDPRLPASLREVAADAPLSLTINSERAQARAWHLYLGEGCPDLSGFGPGELSAESAGAIVHAALRCRIRGATPALDVTASAAIGRYGLDPVGGLESKLKFARLLNMKRVFVASEQSPVDGGGIEIVRAGKVSRSEQLDEIASALDAPPSEEDYHAASAWYSRSTRRPRDERFEYYVRALLPKLAENLRSQAAGREVQTLVLAAGRQAEPIVLATRVLEPSRVILLHEHDNDLITRCREYFRSNAAECDFEPIRVSYRDGSDSIRARLDELVGLEGRVGVDVTSGPKSLAFYLEQWARSRRTRQYCSVSYILTGSSDDGAVVGKGDKIEFFD